MDDGSTIMRKVINKGKVNLFEVSYALAMLEIVILDVVHVLHA